MRFTKEMDLIIKVISKEHRRVEADRVRRQTSARKLELAIECMQKEVSRKLKADDVTQVEELLKNIVKMSREKKMIIEGVRREYQNLHKFVTNLVACYERAHRSWIQREENPERPEMGRKIRKRC